MPRGSKPGERRGGRAKGTPNKASAARQKRVSEGGITPLDYMLKVMRDRKADASRRDDMAKAAAPYVHPRLATNTHQGPTGGPIQTVDLTHASADDLDRLEAIFGPLAGTAGDDAEGDPTGEGAPAG